MRKALYFIMAFFISIGTADAAVRDANSITRQTTTNIPSRKSSDARVATRTISRTPITPRTTARNATTNRIQKTTTSARTATLPTASARNATPTNSQQNTTLARSGARPARATTTTATITGGYGTAYNTCRDAYFTCMDQFCTTANDEYRRCICSSKLSEIQSREHALSQASTQLQDFHDLNIYVIDKSAAEVNAMLSASAGESAHEKANDTSDSTQKLTGIISVLSNAKKQSLSTQGTLDIAGNISAIWDTTHLIGGTNISNLTGESLYNAVHTQCSEMVASQCGSESTRDMVVSAYGMYIENDCSMIINNLDKKLSAANGTIRETERNMNTARLDNYNAHNSTSINDCIAQVRADITSNTACGTDYVHCLDITGLYLSYDTGEPIYSSKFYQLEKQISLSGNVLTNQTNRLLVAKLNSMREYAARGLDTCRDISDDVWDEFMRQAISEIYQGQHDRIRQVKNECLDVVNKCYDTQNKQLRDFSNIDEKLTLGSRLELSEEMCKEKLDTCSNLYGGGAQGLSLLVDAMSDITDQKIGKQCQANLRDYIKNTCAVPGNDTLHAAPYACRMYAPGKQIYATIPTCNMKTSLSVSNDISPFIDEDEIDSISHNCPDIKTYIRCEKGYALARGNVYSSDIANPGNQCRKCNDLFTCNGGTEKPQHKDTEALQEQCGTTYIGSMYHKLARYAMETCVRPSKADKNTPLPDTVLQDINVVMDELHHQMSTELSKECERLGGTWVNLEWVDNISNDPKNTEPDGIHDTSGLTQFTEFYEQTAANSLWGYCSGKSSTTPDNKPNDTQTYTLSFCYDQSATTTGSDCAMPNTQCEVYNVAPGTNLSTIPVPDEMQEVDDARRACPDHSYVHIGWATLDNTISYTYGNDWKTTTMPANAITLYPQWKQIESNDE